MNFLPKASGIRPRVACEIAPGAVVAARAGDVAGTLAAVSSVVLEAGAVAPGLKPGNVVDRIAVVNALRRALEGVGARPNTRNADITIILPDGACRVLLLDFDALPSKLSEALPLVRFRLKKLVPFDADDAMVSFQVMSQSKQLVRVLAVCIPRDVLAEYETATREAGFEPGAVLPSTLAAMAGVGNLGASMLVNVSALSVTTAIAREGILLLHRTVDLQLEPAGVPANLPPALMEPSGVDEFAAQPNEVSAQPRDVAAQPSDYVVLPIVSHEDSAAEWAAQQPLPEYGRDPYADRVRAEEAAQDFDGITILPVAGTVLAAEEASSTDHREPGALADSPYAHSPYAHSPYAGPTVLADLSAELHNAILIAPTSPGTFTDPAEPFAQDGGEREVPAPPPASSYDGEALPAGEFAGEVAQAISVAAAYFEDTLSTIPDAVLACGSMGRAALEHLLHDAGIADAEDLRVRELVDADALAADAATSSVERSALGAVWGALSA